MTGMARKKLDSFSNTASTAYPGAHVLLDDDNSIIMADKANEISSLLSSPVVDLWSLRELALAPGGLVNDNLRKQAWPKLVGLNGVTNDLNPFNDINTLLSATTKAKTKSKQKSMNCNLPSEIKVADPDVINKNPRKYKNKVMAESLDAEQIDLDINRCTWHLLNGTQRSRSRTMRNKHRKKVLSLLRRKQRRLGNLINLVLIQSYSLVEDLEENRLRYYQGYHDVACIFLNALGGGNTSLMPIFPQENPACISDSDSASVSTSGSGHYLSATKTAAAMGLDLPSRVLLQVSFSHFGDAMKSTFKELSAALRLIIMPLIGAFDAEVHSHLYECQMEPFFAISWIITWFSHDIRDTDLVKRLFDVFIVSHPLMPIYMSIAMVLHPANRLEILNAKCDFASVHQALADLPKNSCSVGWKYICNESGYISGDESDDCNSLDQSIGSVDELTQFDDREDDLSSAPSLASTCMLSLGCKVQFQELIDLAITFMRRIPPRKLIPLARKYFIDENAKNLIGQCSTVALLQPPPTWALISTVPSDVILKERIRQSRGMSKTNRRNRRMRGSKTRNSRNRNDSEKKKETEQDSDDKNEVSTILTEKNDHRHSSAVVAAGIGPDGDGDAAREIKRRKLIRNLTIGVGAVAISVALIQSGALSIPVILTKLGQSRSGDSDAKSTGISLPRTEGVCTSPAECQSKGTITVSESKPGNDNFKPIQFIKAVAKSAKAGLEKDAEVIGI